eukprot:s192_g14.t1
MSPNVAEAMASERDLMETPPSEEKAVHQPRELGGIFCEEFPKMQNVEQEDSQEEATGVRVGILKLQLLQVPQIFSVLNAAVMQVDLALEIALAAANKAWPHRTSSELSFVDVESEVMRRSGALRLGPNLGALEPWSPAKEIAPGSWKTFSFKSLRNSVPNPGVPGRRIRRSSRAELQDQEELGLGVCHAMQLDDLLRKPKATRQCSSQCRGPASRTTFEARWDHVTLCHLQLGDVGCLRIAFTAWTRPPA